MILYFFVLPGDEDGQLGQTLIYACPSAEVFLKMHHVSLQQAQELLKLTVVHVLLLALVAMVEIIALEALLVVDDAIEPLDEDPAGGADECVGESLHLFLGTSVLAEADYLQNLIAVVLHLLEHLGSLVKVGPDARGLHDGA